MKKILIVNNNLEVGGIQKSLVNLLKAEHKNYDITLLLFSRSGALLSEVPADIKIISPKNCYKMLGLSKAELMKHPLLLFMKTILMRYAKLFSRRQAMKLLGVFQKKISGYDTIISYSHLTNHKNFANGCGDFVLDKTVCDNKVCLIHCDYLNSGFVSEQNNEEYDEFDKIACCSDSVRMRFIQGSKINEDKVYCLRNFFDVDIKNVSEKDAEHYDAGYINIVSVARLSSEKGIDRAIEAMFNVHRDDIRYYIVGDGPERNLLQEKVNEYNLSNNVFFLGEQKNPYKYMSEADYLLVPSRHEAAPIVFDEAKVLGVPVITTNTTSAEEMVGMYGGYVCENTPEGIEGVIEKIQKATLKIPVPVDNKVQCNQFAELNNKSERRNQIDR